MLDANKSANSSSLLFFSKGEVSDNGSGSHCDSQKDQDSRQVVQVFDDFHTPFLKLSANFENQAELPVLRPASPLISLSIQDLTLLNEAFFGMPRKTFWKSDDEVISLNRSVKIQNRYAFCL